MQELIKIIEETNDLHVLRAILDGYHPYDIAEIVPELDDDSRIKLYQIYNTQEIAEIFSFLDEEETDLFEDISNEYTASIINEMPNDDAVDLFKNLETDKQTEILDLVDNETKENLIKLSVYGEKHAGSLMTSDFIWVLESFSVKEAMKKIVAFAPDAETINTIFVVDKDMVLKGIVDLKSIITAPVTNNITDIMNDHFQSASPTMDIEETVKIIRDYDIYALPITENDRIIGIITMDDAIEAFNEEKGHDYAQFSGLTSEEEYDEGTFTSIKKRIPWLAILLVLDIFVSLIISQFESVIQTVAILFIFQPIILGLSGNSGTQSLAVSVRKISNDELGTKAKKIKYLGRECLVGILQGIIIGLIVFGVSGLVMHFRGEPNGLMISALVSISILCALSVSSLFGALLPIIFTKLRIDPAVASGPFITTINDILTVVIYYGLAFILIGSGII